MQEFFRTTLYILLIGDAFDLISGPYKIRVDYTGWKAEMKLQCFPRNSHWTPQVQWKGALSLCLAMDNSQGIARGVHVHGLADADDLQLHLITTK